MTPSERGDDGVYGVLVYLGHAAYGGRHQFGRDADRGGHQARTGRQPDSGARACDPGSGRAAGCPVPAATGHLVRMARAAAQRIARRDDRHWRVASAPPGVVDCAKDRDVIGENFRERA